MESNDQEVDEEDFYQDNAEVADFVNAHRGQEELAEENTGEHVPLAQATAATLSNTRTVTLCVALQLRVANVTCLQDCLVHSHCNN